MTSLLQAANQNQDETRKTLKVGGTLDPNRHLYITRAEDEMVFQLLVSREYVNILTSRQMGKSSLVAWVSQRMSQDHAIVTISCGELTGANLDEWYRGFLYSVSRGLRLPISTKSWWDDCEAGTPNQKLMQFFAEEIAPHVDRPVVIFVDEIDVTLKDDFADGFFVAIREMYNRRGVQQAYDNITFCLVGVATPNELIKDPRATAYNVGKTIELRDFDRRENVVDPLAREVSNDVSAGKKIVRRILKETGGHPFLTAMLCHEFKRDGLRKSKDVQQLTNRMFVSLESAKRSTVHFETILNNLDNQVADKWSALQLYRRIRRRPIPDETSQASISLKLVGLARRDSRNRLTVRNPLYRRLFDDAWARQQLPPAERRVRNAMAIAKSSLAVAVLFALWGIWLLVDYFHTSRNELLSELSTRFGLVVDEMPDRLQVVANNKSMESIDAAFPLLEQLGDDFELDLRHCFALKGINIPDINRLTSIRLNGCESLKSLRITNSKSLITMDLGKNGLVNLQLSGLDALRQLNLSRLQLLRNLELHDLAALKKIVLPIGNGTTEINGINNSRNTLEGKKYAIERILAQLESIKKTRATQRTQEPLNEKEEKEKLLAEAKEAGSYGARDTELEDLSPSVLKDIDSQLEVLDREHGLAYKEVKSSVALTDIDLRGLSQIESINFSFLVNLENLSINGLSQLSSVKMPYCRSLRVLRYENLPKLSAPVFTGDLSELRLNRLTVDELAISSHSNLRSLSIDRLPNLSKLVISDCWNLFDLSDISAVHSLETIEIHNCGRLPVLNGISGAPNLARLVIGNCKDLDDLHRISKVSSIRELRLSRCSLESLSGMPQMSNFHCIELESIKELKDLNGISGITNLKKLQLVHCSSLQTLHGVAESRNLEQLEIKRCSEIVDLKGVAKSPNLKKLKIEGCNFTDLRGLSDVNKLERLEIANCSSLAELTGIVGTHNLTVLKVDGCNSLENLRGLITVRNLRSLGVSKEYGRRGLKDLESISYMTGLRRLSLVGINNAEIDLSKLSSLEILDLSDSDNLEVHGLSKLSELRAISVAGTKFRRGIALQDLHELPNLSIVYAAGYPPEDVLLLKKAQPNIRTDTKSGKREISEMLEKFWIVRKILAMILIAGDTQPAISDFTFSNP